MASITSPAPKLLAAAMAALLLLTLGVSQATAARALPDTAKDSPERLQGTRKILQLMPGVQIHFPPGSDGVHLPLHQGSNGVTHSEDELSNVVPVFAPYDPQGKRPRPPPGTISRDD